MRALKSLSENDGAAPRPIYELLLNANNTARMGIGVDVHARSQSQAIASRKRHPIKLLCGMRQRRRQRPPERFRDFI